MVRQNESSEQRLWRLRIGEREYGPLSEAQVVHLWRQGMVPPTAEVFDGVQWRPLSFVNGRIREAADAVSPHSPPPRGGNGSVATPPPLPPRVAAAPPPPPAAPTAPPAPAPAAAVEEEDDGPPERDRIVVLGRTRSGKTIYLARVYQKLWRSLDGLTAKALTGPAHRALMQVNQDLKEGRWPDATRGATQLDLELEYHGRKRLMVTLDFAGELFRKAFVEEQHDWPGVKELVRHIDRAAAVIVLVDPSVVAGMDHEAAMDDDFGIVQAVQRIRNWPGGEDVPIVLVLTKIDVHQELLDRLGGPLGFVRAHFPALVRMLKQIPIFLVSAVQSEVGPDGRPRPRPDSVPVNLDQPLRHCLRLIEQAELHREEQAARAQREALAARLAREQRVRERRQNHLLAIAVVAILLLGLAVALGILLSGD